MKSFVVSLVGVLLSLNGPCSVEGVSNQWVDYFGDRTRESKWFSEENGGYSGVVPALMSGIRLSGRYSDNKQIIATQFGTFDVLLANPTWTGWFSEEEGTRTCPSGKFIREIQCRGKYCDGVRLACSSLPRNFRVASGNVLSPEASEESGITSCPSGHFASGLRCSGRYCDNISLVCQKVQFQKPIQITAGTQCVDSPTRENSGKLHFWDCDGKNKNQWWVFESDGLIRLFGTNFCLENNGGSNEKISLGVCNSNSVNQKWTVEENKYIKFSQDKTIGIRNNGIAKRGNEILLQSFSETTNPGSWTFPSVQAGLSEAELVLKFAPQLRFDQSGDVFPMEMQDWWENSKDYSSQCGQACRDQKQLTDTNAYDPSKMALHYEINMCNSGGRVLITYWIFYHNQNACYVGQGAHRGDWEHVVVELNSNRDRVKNVQYAQHSGYYTRYDPIIVENTHAVVYVGKKSHGSYHDDGGTGGPFQCMYFNDFRNENPNNLKRFSSWKQGRLLPVYGDQPWHNYRGQWGIDGIKGPIDKNVNFCTRGHCKSTGCDKSQVSARDTTTSNEQMDSANTASNEKSIAVPAGIAGGATFGVVAVAVIIIKARRRRKNQVTNIELSNTQTNPLHEEL